MSISIYIYIYKTSAVARLPTAATGVGEGRGPPNNIRGRERWWGRETRESEIKLRTEFYRSFGEKRNK